MIDADGLAAAFRRVAAQHLAAFSATVTTSCDPDPPSGRLFVADARATTPIGKIGMLFGDREFEIRTSLQGVPPQAGDGGRCESRRGRVSCR